MKRNYTKLLAVLLTAALILTGCQTTPDTDVVIRKDLQQMLGMAASPTQTAGSLADTLGVPERYEDYFEDATRNVKVTVNAKIVLPEANTAPVIRVMPQAFSQETANRLIDALFADGPLYTPESLSAFSKTDIVQWLTLLKQKKSELESQGMTPSTQETQPASDGGSGAVAMSGTVNQLDGVIESIHYYEELLKTAPEENTLAKADTTADFTQSYFVQAGQKNPGSGISALTIVGDNSATHLASYVNRGDYDSSGGQYQTENAYAQNENDSARAEADALAYPVISEQHARELADEFIADIGIDYLDCALVEKVIGGSATYLGGSVRLGKLIKAYRLHYIRSVNGMPVTYTDVRGAWDDTDRSAIWSWDYEAMTFIIDDSGIVEMEWNAPYKLTDTVVQSATMLPFSRIRDVCQRMIPLNSADKTTAPTEIEITEIRLGLARITEQNNLNNGLLIPVWDFFGTATYHFDTTDKDYVLNDLGKSFLTINAIDGSVIDRNLGN